jgi:hypothetical protein
MMNYTFRHLVQVDERRLQLKMPSNQSRPPQVAVRQKRGTRATFAAIWCRSKRIMECHLELGARAPRDPTVGVWHFAAFTGAGRAECAPRFCIRCNRSAAVVNYLPVLRSKSIAGVYGIESGMACSPTAAARSRAGHSPSGAPPDQTAPPRVPPPTSQPNQVYRPTKSPFAWSCLWKLVRNSTCALWCADFKFVNGFSDLIWRMPVGWCGQCSYLWLKAPSVNCA